MQRSLRPGRDQGEGHDLFLCGLGCFSLCPLCSILLLAKYNKGDTDHAAVGGKLSLDDSSSLLNHDGPPGRNVLKAVHLAAGPAQDDLLSFPVLSQAEV